MSGVMMMMLGSGGGFQPIAGASFNSSTTATGAGTSQASVTYNVDGTGTERQGGPSYSYTTGPWGSPSPIANIGLQYWLSSDLGAWTQINGVAFTLTGGNASATHSIRIATDSAGTNIVATQTVNLSTTNGL